MAKATRTAPEIIKELRSAVAELNKLIDKVLRENVEKTARLRELEDDMIAQGATIIDLEDRLELFEIMYRESNNPYNSKVVLEGGGAGNPNPNVGGHGGQVMGSRHIVNVNIGK